MTTRSIAIALVLTAAGGPVAHAERGGRGGMVGRPGGGVSHPSGGSPSFSRPAAGGANRPANFNPGQFNRPNPGNAAGVRPTPGAGNSFGNRPSFGGINNGARPNPGGNLVGQHPGGVTRPSFGDGLGVANHANVGNNVGNTVVNRPTVGSNNVVNRQNVTNVNRNVNNVVTNNITQVNRSGYGYGGGYRPGYGYGYGGGYRPGYGYGYGGGYRPGYGYGGWGGGYGGWGGYGGYRPNPYYGYHSGWVNGYWNGNYNSGWGWNNFGNSALGWGLGIGVAAWGIGSMFNSWGYSSYANPYYYSSPTVVVQQPVVVGQPLAAQNVAYDYSRPLDLSSPPPPQNVSDQALAVFDSARAAFRAGDYRRALSLGDQAIAQMPNDPMLHEFRAFCLFALGRYDEAAVPLYTVLSAGPGWDWTTLVHLYSNIDVYTAQLRALEQYCAATPKAASARFLLGALYMTQGSNEAAAGRFKEVAALQPQDRLSAQLVTALTPGPPTQSAPALAGPSQNAPGPDQPPPNPTPAQAPGGAPAGDLPPFPTGPVPSKLVGSWTASPTKDVSITLAVTGEKSFVWKVNDHGQAREFKGEATFDNGTLALATPDQPPMVGKVTWNDDGRFQFKALGAPAGDPGLNFAK
ncbi:MAG: tetratricopeptide repeat protein [Isosphaeraceae bacterium]|nr:tetratricopeptide repeat protein [Isosphaeraceae bacterium]